MSRYIDADAISAELREMAENDYFKCAGAPYSVIFERVAETFDKMPTAQPEPQWIPCSERLPEDKKAVYWVCNDNGHQFECRWTNTNHFWTELTTDWHWNIFDVPQYSKAVAWMPLPEPYKEETEHNG